MKIVTIPQKQSNTGSIHDIASSQYDRDIKFPEGHKYAVVMAAYYGGRGYSTHKTEAAAIRKSRQSTEYSHIIMDPDGNQYDVYGDTLRKTIIAAD